VTVPRRAGRRFPLATNAALLAGLALAVSACSARTIDAHGHDGLLLVRE
jgi:hypothetical protein